MTVPPERRAQAQIAYRQIWYDHQDGKITLDERDQAMREWQATWPEFVPGSGCCANIGDAE